MEPAGASGGGRGSREDADGLLGFGEMLSGRLESAGSAVAVGQKRGGAARLRTGERARGRGLLRCSRAP